MGSVHWVGTGLSAVPGLRQLITAGHDVVVWNRTLDKARNAVGDLTADIRSFNLERLAVTLKQGDVVVSMLPGDWHVQVAKVCLEAHSHFVSSSYRTQEMLDLDSQAKRLGLALVNEVGLDPGIDHVMAHWLVADYRESDGYDSSNELSFLSYCGGIPKVPNDFRYKFSWFPLGVLKALQSTSRSIKEFDEFSAAFPWKAVENYTAPLSSPEVFEVYPNRDSLPFLDDYNFNPDWQIKTFVRGTIRLSGWADAWADIFSEIEVLEGTRGERRLREMSDELWAQHAYAKNELDRVVLCVSLKAEQAGQVIYHKTYTLDAFGDENTTAMARLVSGSVAIAVESILAEDIKPGVSITPSSQYLVERWLTEISKEAQQMNIVNHKCLS